MLKKTEAEDLLKTVDEARALHITCAYTTPFCRASQNSPYYAALFATDKALDELKKVVANMPEDAILTMHYDTTYEYGNYFISVLSYRHPFLQRTDGKAKYLSDMPIVPVFYCLHEKKFEDTHKWLFNRMEYIFDQRYLHARRKFSEVDKALVSDREYYGHKLLHNCKTVHCWLHLRKNVEFAAKKRHLSVNEMDAVIKDFNAMLCSTSEQSYIKRRDEMMQQPHWRNTGMAEYFLKDLDNDLLQYSGRWVLNRLKIGHDSKGITNNPAETMNSSISRLTNKDNKKSSKAWEGVLTLLEYAQHTDKDIDNAYYGTNSQIQVHKNFEFMKKPMTSAPPVDIDTFKDIVSSITNELAKPHDNQVSIS
jgi:hypothetical protein